MSDLVERLMSTQWIDVASRETPVNRDGEAAAYAIESLLREKVALQNKLIDVQRSLIERNNEVFKLRVEHSAAIERKDAALAEIAKQKLTTELDEEETESAEFEEAYDAIIKIARAALEE